MLIGKTFPKWAVQWICVREKIQQTHPYFMGKSRVSGSDFPLSQSIEPLRWDVHGKLRSFLTSLNPKKWHSLSWALSGALGQAELLGPRGHAGG